jgi:hypothetical protein
MFSESAGGIVHTIKENAEALVVASKKIGLDINPDKTKYVVMSEDQRTEQSHSVKLIIVPLRGWKSSNIWEQH